MSNCIAVGGHAPTTAIPTGKFYGKLCVRSQTTNARFAVKFCQKGIQRGKRAELASASRSVVLFAACRVPRHAPWRSSRGPFPAPFPTLRRRVGPARDVDRADGLFKSLLWVSGKEKQAAKRQPVLWRSSRDLNPGGAVNTLRDFESREPLANRCRRRSEQAGSSPIFRGGQPYFGRNAKISSMVRIVLKRPFCPGFARIFGKMQDGMQDKREPASPHGDWAGADQPASRFRKMRDLNPILRTNLRNIPFCIIRSRSPAMEVSQYPSQKGEHNHGKHDPKARN